MMQTINGKQLYYAFAAGGEALISQREVLNKLNVFPVPDGDTGSNLSYTLKTIIDTTEIYPEAGTTMQSIAKSALIGARGNSGILFAQFVNGMAEKMVDVSHINLDDFVDSVNHAVKRAYQAISNPVEGTMLTVMKDWALAAQDALSHVKDFPGMFNRSVESARTSLADTINKLEHLKRAGVIDAGAKGFVEFLQGFQDFLSKGAMVDHLHDRPTISMIGATDEDAHAALDDLEDLTYRFCTEGIVSGKDIDTELVRAALSDLGDSFIVAGGGQNVRIHIHTNQPDEAFYRLKSFGVISHQKVDDMARQMQVMKGPKTRVALVVDSTCDLPDYLMDQHQIHMAPLSINFGENSFLDRLTIGPTQFYKLLKEDPNFPTTSQPSPSIFSRLYGHLSSYYDSIISIHIAKALSGTYQNSLNGSQEFSKQISVVDSRHASASMALIALETARALEAGATHNQALELIDNLINRADFWVSTPNMNNFIRGGRVSKMKGMIGKILGVRPIIGVTPEGKSSMKGKAYSFKGAVQKSIKQLEQNHKTRQVVRFCVTHANNDDTAGWVAHEVEKILGFGPEFISQISPVLGAHGGEGAINLAVLYRD
jgi:DegV family protein with EDD domain